MAMLPYSKLKHSSRHILSFGIVLILTFVFNPRALASTECKTLHTAGAQQWFPYAFNEFEGRLKATGRLITAPFAAEEVYVVLSPSLSQTRGTDLSLNALAQYIGVMPRGISLGEKFDSIKSNLNIIEVKDHDKMYEMMRRHRADYAVSPQSAALSHLNDPENDGMRISQSPISSNNVHFAISAKSKCASLFPEFNQALSGRLKDGSIKQIIDTYDLTR